MGAGRERVMIEDVIRDFGWLMYPIFGIAIAIFGVMQGYARQDAVLRDARERLERGQ